MILLVAHPKTIAAIKLPAYPNAIRVVPDPLAPPHKIYEFDLEDDIATALLAKPHISIVDVLVANGGFSVPPNTLIAEWSEPDGLSQLMNLIFDEEDDEDDEPFKRK